jgi:protein-S-isoprenylcysteine O-methyltransferase Ste14
MSNRLFGVMWGVLFFVVVVVCQPVAVFAADEETEPGWVLAYALVVVCLLGAVALLSGRLAGRKNTVFTDTEIAARREAELKKSMKH